MVLLPSSKSKVRQSQDLTGRIFDEHVYYEWHFPHPISTRQS